MKPIYSIRADTKDITSLIKNRLLSLEVTDESGFQSDQVSIELDDRDNPFELPRKGVELDISMGFDREGKKVLVHMGTFVVDEVSCSGPPDKLTIEGKAANMTADFKEKKTRPWDNVSLSDIVVTIAGAHGLIPVIGTDLAVVAFDHLDQSDESDLHFLTRLAREHDAVAKPASRHLIFLKKGEAATATGAALPVVTLTRQDFVEPGWDMQARDRGTYKTITAFHQDIEGGNKIPVSVGSGKPVSIIRTPFASGQRALQAAKARADKLERGASTLTGSVSARIDLFAEGRIHVTGIRPGVNGPWNLTRVTRKINDTGLSVSFEAEVPK